MSDCRIGIDRLTQDKKEKKERYENQRKTLDELTKTNKEKKEAELDGKCLIQSALDERMANEIDLLHKQRSDLQDRSKKLKYARDRQKQLFSDIKKVEEDLARWRQENEEKIVGYL